MPTARSWLCADRRRARDGFLISGFSPQNQGYNRPLGVLTMPIYEYRCKKCGHQEEFLQKASESALSKCPACGKATFQKLLSAAGFQLKGTGWYATDFKKSAEKKPAAKIETKTETKTEAKTEAKAEPKKAACTTD
jgi:putative FmdB family regulatory protein